MASIFSQSFWGLGKGQQIAEEYKYVIWIGIACYLPMVYLGQAFMRNRSPMRLKRTSIIWNFSFSTFSGLGALIYLIYKPQVLTTMALSDEDNHPWIRAAMTVFTVSKLFEFGDTLLLILKKKPLIFLHVYHHFTVALYCWHSLSITAQYGHLFAFINLVIHWWMYLYYGLAIIIPRHPLLRAVRPYITMAQILQMFAGMALAASALRLPTVTGILRTDAMYALLMYISYAYLFILFYLENYVKGVRPIMAIAVGTLHLAAVAGLKLLFQHPQRLHFLVEMALCFALSVVLVQRFAGMLRNAGEKLKAAQHNQVDLNRRWTRCLLMVLNPWMTWAVEHHQLQKWYEAIVPQKESADKATGPSSQLHKKDSKGASKRQRSLAKDLVADVRSVATELVQHLNKKTDSTDSPTVPSYLGQSKFKEDWLLFIVSMLIPAVYGRLMHNSCLLGFLVHGCLRWCIELYTTGRRIESKTC